ncbi:hypothetical protein [Pseudomonas sp. LP_7_YM]|uniref:hypothetical protein n=1 Tax=Pseudomonas sp. LP_7_YM TaxID=2485137 RepID=UPI0010610BE6|nr:hypothetical protein [Pseudomonas sp. LP_7_YM]
MQEATIKKIRLAISALEVSIVEGNEALRGIISAERLLEFKSVFNEVLSLLSQNTLPPKSHRHLGIAHIVVDQWPINLELGEILIDAEQSYVEL